MPHLLPLLKDDVLEVRRVALGAIASIGADRYDTIADEVLAFADSENTQMRLDVEYLLQRAARDDATNERLIRILLNAYSDDDATMRKAVLTFFDTAQFDHVKSILTKLSENQNSDVQNAAKQILERTRKAALQRELRTTYAGPLFIFRLTEGSMKQPGYFIGGVLGMRQRLEHYLVREVWQRLMN